MNLRKIIKEAIYDSENINAIVKQLISAIDENGMQIQQEDFDTKQKKTDIFLCRSFKLKNGVKLYVDAFNYNAFSRSFTLPSQVVDAENIAASYTDGILKIVIPKKVKEENAVKTIEIK